MIGFLARRFAQSLLLILGVITIVFLVVRVIPGDPAELILDARATPEQVDQLRDEMGLNDPLVVQYLDRLADIARLDFGESWRLGGDALVASLERLPATVALASVALLITLAVSFPLGVFAARRVGRWGDRVVSSLALVGQALPSFWVGIVLILVFARGLDLLPSTAEPSLAGLLLPAFTLSLPFLGWLARLVRNGVLDEMHQDYVRTARSKGLSSRVVFYVHVLRNTLTPVVTVLGLLMGNFIADAVIVEVVFAWPGIGQLLVDSIMNRDYAVTEAVVIIIAVFYILLNLLVDIAYSYLDPRVSLENV